VGGISDRKQEIKRRRHRRKKIEVLKRRLKKSTTSERTLFVEKIRRMTPGCDVVVANLGLATKT
jgi:hypothetical protein